MSHRGPDMSVLFNNEFFWRYWLTSEPDRKHSSSFKRVVLTPITKGECDLLTIDDGDLISIYFVMHDSIDILITIVWNIFMFSDREPESDFNHDMDFIYSTKDLLIQHRTSERVLGWKDATFGCPFAIKLSEVYSFHPEIASPDPGVNFLMLKDFVPLTTLDEYNAMTTICHNTLTKICPEIVDEIRFYEPTNFSEHTWCHSDQLGWFMRPQDSVYSLRTEQLSDGFPFELYARALNGE